MPTPKKPAKQPRSSEPTETVEPSSRAPVERKSPMLATTVSKEVYNAVQEAMEEHGLKRSVVVDNGLRIGLGLGAGPEGWKIPMPPGFKALAAKNGAHKTMAAVEAVAEVLPERIVERDGEGAPEEQSQVPRRGKKR
jgi:hypothetical protein